jgi:hypothetical protein
MRRAKGTKEPPADSIPPYHSASGRSRRFSNLNKRRRILVLSPAPAPPQEQCDQQEEGNPGGYAGHFSMSGGGHRLPLFQAGAMNVLHLLAIAPAQGIPANDGDLFQHFGAIFQVAHACAFIVSPTDRNLHNAKTAL